MIIIHENLPNEAKSTAEVIKQVYGLDSKIIGEDLGNQFAPIPEFNGYRYSYLLELQASFQGKALLVLTPRDIYVGDSKNDDWIFGYNTGNLSVVSTARIKRWDSQPSDVIGVPLDLYLKRLSVMDIHEIGHDVVSGNHFQPAKWVNIQSGHELDLGPHCTDNTCAMYEIVDIKSPTKSEGHMLLGQDKKFDAGLDDVIARLSPRWFCDKCYSSISIDERYK